MNSDPDWLPRSVTEPRLLIELTQSELAALVIRLVPHGTWMAGRARTVVMETFGGDAEQAARVADRITDRIIQIHDRGF